VPMVRKNPLPPGRYWIYIQKAAQDIFDLWLKKNPDVVTVEKKETSGALWPIIAPDETFYVFNVKEPTIWPRGVGFPNTADAAVKSSNDVTKRGPPTTAKDVLKDIEQTASEAAKSVFDDFKVVAIIALAAWLVLGNSRR
jgi:hypothetical protein